MSKAYDTNLNRKIILNCVQRHLLESLAELGEMRPLGEMIPRIARELRGISKTNNFATAAVAIIPMPLIAAFVDGDVSTDEDRMICNAVLVTIVFWPRLLPHFVYPWRLMIFHCFQIL